MFLPRIPEMSQVSPVSSAAYREALAAGLRYRFSLQGVDGDEYLRIRPLSDPGTV